MKTNSFLTYLLYALLTGLIGVAGYKACQMKRDQARSARENEEFQKTLRDLGYVGEDSTASSQYVGETTPGQTAPATPGGNPVVTTKDGIEDEYPAPATTTPANKPAPIPASKPKEETVTKTNQIRDLDTDNSDGRYRVIAGSFRRLDGARREMERIIRMGYHDAEVGYYNKHTYAVVIVKRTNSLNEAVRLVDQLEGKGIDASIIDRERKK